MKPRHLPVGEWPRLSGTELETVWPHLDPQRSVVIVVEDNAGEIVACWSLFYVLHAEGLWIRKDHRKKSSVARRLWGAMLAAARAAGVKSVATSAMSDEVKTLLQHVEAIEIPGSYYSMRIH